MFTHIITYTSYFQIKLADKQAALEKTQWEAMTSDKRVEKLQEELDAIRGDVSLIMSLFEGLTEHDATLYSGDTDITPYRADDLPWMVRYLPRPDCCFLFLLCICEYISSLLLGNHVQPMEYTDF